MRMQKGFTLIELMVVVAIVAILAAVGFPAYTDYVTRGKLMDATSGLSDGKVKMEQYYQDHPAAGYANATCPSAACPAATKYFTFGLSNLAKDTFTLTATGSGNLSAYSYTINETSAKTSNTPWGNGATCWILKKGDSC